MNEEWALDIRDNCAHNNVPFFFKQWGGVNKKKHGRLLQGKTYDAMPRIGNKATMPDDDYKPVLRPKQA